jgi:hypothetical protein
MIFIIFQSPKIILSIISMLDFILGKFHNLFNNMKLFLFKPFRCRYFLSFLQNNYQNKICKKFKNNICHKHQNVMVYL